MTRYQVDRRQADRVRGTALSILEQLRGPATSPEAEADNRPFLVWAARLHEIGIPSHTTAITSTAPISRPLPTCPVFEEGSGAAGAPSSSGIAASSRKSPEFRRATASGIRSLRFACRLCCIARETACRCRRLPYAASRRASSSNCRPAGWSHPLTAVASTKNLPRGRASATDCASNGTRAAAAADMDRPAAIRLEVQGGRQIAFLTGSWTLVSLPESLAPLEAQIRELASADTLWNLEDLARIDSAGAVLLWRCWNRSWPADVRIPDAHRRPGTWERLPPGGSLPPPGAPHDSSLEWFGLKVLGLRHLRDAVTLIGALLLDIGWLLRHPREIPFREFSATLYKAEQPWHRR